MAKINKVGHVVLAVKDPEASANWYKDVLGMDVMYYNDKGQMAFLSFGTQHHDIAVVKAPEGATLGSPGISHTALQIDGGLDELKELYQRMKDRGVEIDFTTDHGLSQSVYFFDPDGNRLEVFCETMTPEEGIEFMKAGRAGRAPLELEAAPAD
jgi:catechol-2,3-dioxygenase